VLIALLVCLIPTTIGALLSAIGIAGMDRMIRANVIATSGRAVEAAGDVDVLLLDKTGTITLGNRQAVAFHPAPGIERAPWPTPRSWLRWPTKRRKAAASWCWQGEVRHLRERELPKRDAQFVPFTAQTRMSGVDIGTGGSIRKGALDAVRRYLERSAAICRRWSSAWPKTSPVAAPRR
jgi:K+-transporting ATPase ATPase B chain